jgi:hypothetical protein
MKNVLIKTLAALAVASAVSTVALADPITGGITFGQTNSHGVDLTNIAPGVFTAAFSGAATTGGAGTFASTGIDAVSIATLTLFGASPSLLTSGDLPGPTDNGGNLWSFSDTGVNYWFQATTLSVTSAGDGWIVGGAGWFSDNAGDSTTLGTYELTFDAQGDLSSFSSASIVNVPDGGTTALLVGLGLLGLGVYARRSKLAKA